MQVPERREEEEDQNNDEEDADLVKSEHWNTLSCRISLSFAILF